MLETPFATRRGKSGVLTVFFSVFVLLALAASVARAASLYSLVPLDSPVTAAVDLPQVWKATADLRKTDTVNNGLQAMEKEFGLSFEKDLLPWVGQTALVMTDVRKDGPTFALFLQIRDADHMIGSARTEAIVQSLLANKQKTNWLAADYKGISFRRTEIPQGGSVLKVATATLDGWLVITFGDGVIRKLIDTQHGDTPSLEKHPLFARAMNGMQADALGQVCVNGQGILAQIRQNDAEAARQWQHTELGNFLLAGTMTAPGDLQLDVNYCSLNPTTQATLKQLRTDAGTITGASLSYLPQGTFATLLLNNPDKWVSAVEQLLLDSARDDGTRTGIQRAFAFFDVHGVRAVLKRCTGELGVGVAWRDGKGCGVTVAGQTGSLDNAAATSAALKSFWQDVHMQVDRQGNIAVLPATKADMGPFKTLLCWVPLDQWLVGASHPDWIDPAVKPLELPADANNANLALFGNFSFLPAMLKSMGGAPEALTQLTGGKLGQWAMTLKIDEDGGEVHCRTSGAMPVVAVMASVMFPVFANAREKARETTSMSQLRQIAIAVQMYTQDNNGKLPPFDAYAHFTNAIDNYLGNNTAMFHQPGTDAPYVINHALNGLKVSAITIPADTVVVYEAMPWPDGMRNVAFADGHVLLVTEAEWAKLKKTVK